MKKYISLLAVVMLGLFTFSACDTETDEEPGGTNIEKMCGYWDVMYYAIDANGENLGEWTDGTIFTYNTADNSTSEMWLDDQNTYWAIKLKVDIDYEARTFSATERDYDLDGTGKTVITDGKILEGAGKNIHGNPCDSIAFEISFDDDPYPGRYGFDHYLVTGVRHSGFTE